MMRLAIPAEPTRVPPGCQHIVDRLSDYLDGDLADPERWEVKLHLEACARCARFAAELAATVRALHRLGH
jgi:anti-sigma factor RsiW